MLRNPSSRNSVAVERLNVLLLLSGMFLSVSVGCATPLSAQETEELVSAIATTDTEIAAAEEESAKYSGGLVKTLIELRLATLKQTRAMLDQRLQSDSYDIVVTYTVDGHPFVAPDVDLAALETEIGLTKAKIVEQQAHADRYSGGLVRAMAVSTVATTSQTLAMLEQRTLAAKYGLPQYVGAAGSTAPETSPTPAAAPSKKALEITDIDARVTESNSTWSKFAWKLTVRNRSDSPQRLDATIEFQDKDGFVVDDDRERGLVVPANDEATFTGYTLVDADVAGTVSRTVAKGR